jgi:hypothetical protein
MLRLLLIRRKMAVVVDTTGKGKMSGKSAAQSVPGLGIVKAYD